MTSAGFLNIFKPPGMTSHDVVGYLRKQLHPKKMGHGGTLDPVACGVLVCLANGATKLSARVSAMPKTYRAVALFGIRTDTGDAEGKVVEEDGAVIVERPDLEAVLEDFTGEIEQRPPMTSAVKVGGRRLYKLARQGIEVERPPRKVTIHRLSLVEMWEGAMPRALLEIECSGGTYVRSLVEDIGKAMGAPATTAFLVRTAIGRFRIEDSVPPGMVTPETVENLITGPEALEESRS